MILANERVGPYLRALGACLRGAAPHEGFPSYPAALAHLRALDPALSGALLAPAEVHDGSGMPAWTWMERARAEGAVAAVRQDDGAVERASKLDHALGLRMAWRRDLHAHLRAVGLLPSLATTAVLLRLIPDVEVEVVHDRIEGDGRWTRIRALFAGGHDLGLAQVGAAVTLDPGVGGLFTRTADLELPALHAALSGATTGRVRRVTRGQVGPFWFPSVELPAGVPPAWGQGIVLHLVWTALGDDVAESARWDPIAPPEPGLAPPPGLRLAHHRRLVGQGAPIPGLEALT